MKQSFNRHYPLTTSMGCYSKSGKGKEVWQGPSLLVWLMVVIDQVTFLP